MSTQSFLAADPKIDALHADALALSVQLQEALAQMKFRGDGRFARGALWSMWADACALHQGVHSLCAGGHALAAPLLLRTLFELYLGTAVIVNSGRRDDFMAFKYMCGFLIDGATDRALPEPKRASARALLKEMIDQLPQEFRNEANDFALGAKRRKYWYNPEFTAPGEIIKRYGRGEIGVLYRLLSGSVHGGFGGMRLYKDEPDRISPEPRRDAAAQNRALLESSRLLVELSAVRARWDAADELASEFVEWFSRMDIAVKRVGLLPGQ
jgi:hypothetical protein